jgi:hypothetical protein
MSKYNYETTQRTIGPPHAPSPIRLNQSANGNLAKITKTLVGSPPSNLKKHAPSCLTNYGLLMEGVHLVRRTRARSIHEGSSRGGGSVGRIRRTM